MARALLFLVPRGNSQAIHTLPDDIQGEVSRFYIEVFALWEGRTYPYVHGLLGPIGVLAALLAWKDPSQRMASHDAWWLALACYLIAFLISLRAYRESLQEAEESLSELMELSSDPDRIIEALHEIDPLRAQSLNVRWNGANQAMEKSNPKPERTGQQHASTTCLVLTYDGTRSARGTVHDGSSTRTVRVSISESGGHVMTSHSSSK